MALMGTRDHRFAQAVSDLAYCNPFLPERIAYERAALGDEFDERAARWNIDADYSADNPNLVRICQRCQEVLDAAAGRLGKATPSGAEVPLLEDLALFFLYHRYREGFDRTIAEGRLGKPTRKRTGLYDAFAA